MSALNITTEDANAVASRNRFFCNQIFMDTITQRPTHRTREEFLDFCERLGVMTGNTKQVALTYADRYWPIKATTDTDTTNAVVFECYAAPTVPVVALAPRKPVQIAADDDDGYMAALLADADRIATARKPVSQPVAKPAAVPTPRKAYQRRALTIVDDAAMDDVKSQPGFQGFGRYFMLSQSEYDSSLHDLARPEWVDQWVCYAYFVDVAVEQPAVAPAPETVAEPAAPAAPPLTKTEKRKPLAACRRPRTSQKQDAAPTEAALAPEQPIQTPCRVTQFESPSRLVVAPAWMANTPFFDARMAFAL
jgi:hypothetical protein